MRHFLLLAVFLFAAACADKADDTPTTTGDTEEPAMTAPPPQPAATPDPVTTPPEKTPEPTTGAETSTAKGTFQFAPDGPVSDEELGNYYVELECAVDGDPVGTIVLTFWPEKAPQTVRNFLRYCDEGFYNGVTFHRIMRDFMVQGGDPTGTGGGDGPYGTIPAEFSSDEQYSHEYGVISMARGGSPDSASCQFFICSTSNSSTWGLNGQYASFGKMVFGVETLEALANVPTTMSPGGEQSTPTKTVSIVKTTVKEGTPATMETIARPQPDLGGEPATVTVRHVLVAFKEGSRSLNPRTKEEAEALATQILERIEAGENIDALIREHSDDTLVEGDPAPGSYRMTNRGITDTKAERAMFDLQKRYQDFMTELGEKRTEGTVTTQEFSEQMQTFQKTLQAEARSFQVLPRDRMVSGFGDVAFGLEVGQAGIATYDPTASPYGWHVILRIE